MLDSKMLRQILIFQKNEMTEHRIYLRLAAVTRSPGNKQALEKIAAEELAHYRFWKTITGRDIAPDSFRVFLFVMISRILGLTFGLKLMESGEGRARLAYSEISRVIPEAGRIEADEEIHEKQILGLLDEDFLRYISSAVLGLNDAIVELTGALAGFTLTLQNPRLIATAGLITGIAASFSMATSEYLSTRSEESGKNPLKAAFYTGMTYILTVTILITPFLLLRRVYVSLAISVVNAVWIIALFTFYLCVAKGLPFRKRFLEMITISLGVASLTFGIGFLIRTFVKVDL
jgi:VIT1/CCC1 family predicted Fe2+/Mn2+ transporter